MFRFLPAYGESLFIRLPSQMMGWLGLLLTAGLLVWGLSHVWKPPFIKSSRHVSNWLLLLLTQVVCSLMIGITLPNWEILPVPNIPSSIAQPTIFLLSSLPWVLAAGTLHPLLAIIVAGVGGLVTAFTFTHSIFTIIEFMGLALFYSWFVHQAYAHKIFARLRQPVPAALGTLLGFIPAFILISLFTTQGAFAAQIDYALTQSWPHIACRAIELVFASVVVHVLRKYRSIGWIAITRTIASPIEKSLETRMTAIAALVVATLFLTVIISNWVVAGSNTKKVVYSQLSQAAEITAQAMPLALDSGQSLIQTIAASDLGNLPEHNIQTFLASQIRSYPYFSELFFFDATGKPITGYPLNQLEDLLFQPSEDTGVQLALNGVEMQTYVISPGQSDSAAQLSYIALVRNNSKRVAGVLIGRTNLASNPLLQSAMQTWDAINKMDGQVGILDENQRWIMSTRADQVMTQSLIDYSQQIGMSEGLTSSGTREYREVVAMSTRPWFVVVTMPAIVAQQTVLENSIPLLLVLLVLSAAIFLTIRFSLQGFVKKISLLEGEATSIAHGQLGNPVQVVGLDEVGRLGTSFESMRVSLRSRLEELGRLLDVSRSVAGHLDLNLAIPPILEAALVSGATSARIVLSKEGGSEETDPTLLTFGRGTQTDLYAYLDHQLFGYISAQEFLTLPNTSRVKRFEFLPEARPGALVAFAVRQDVYYFGTLWLAYDQPHLFVEEEVRYLSTLASQAALAASTSRLYMESETRRLRMEAVLGSTPEPVMMFDQAGQLLYINPAAMRVEGLVNSDIVGSDIRDVVSPPELVAALSVAGLQKTTTHQVQLKSGRTFAAIISPVAFEQESAGRICLLQDITQFKEVDEMKTAFVSTVSHDLKRPLELIHGYASMLQMVGELGEQQRGYVEKILAGIDSMNHLVSDLLDLGRIESGVGVKLEPIQPEAIAWAVVTAVKPLATQKKIGIKLEIDAPKEPQLVADGALIRQALYNLVDNAICYSKMNGQVIIAYSISKEAGTFSVKDEGVGIAPLDLPYVFDRYHRPQSREKTHQGTGLGLAIVKSIVEWHHGSTWVESQLGKGSTFFIRIPFNSRQKEN
jgi:PAS domain S-box-containing protein